MAFLEVSSPRWTRRIDLIADPIRIGRLPENEINYNDDGLSRQHCVIESADGAWRVRDLASRNGMKVNGTKVPLQVLGSGDIIRVGSIEIRYLEQQGAEVVMSASPPPQQARAKPQATIDIDAKDVAAQSSYESDIRRVIDSSLAKPFGETDIALVDARGAVLHAAQGQGDTGEDAPAESVYIYRLLLLACFRARASDLHIEPRTDIALVRFRVDGTMVTICDLPLQVYRRILGVVKVLCQFDQSMKNEVLDGHFTVNVRSRRVDYRVSLTPAVHGQKMVVRVLDPATAPGRLHEMGLLPWMYEKVRVVCNRDAGLILVCGPTGSGKTTSLYSCLREINLVERNAITIEDPVEYQIEGATQIPIDSKQGHTFGGLLRSVLRQDPDVILVGEIRDLETATVAMQAAMTGHLVFSTVHARDTIGTIFRLMDLGVESYQVANALNLVIAQRLVRVLCGTCRKAVTPTPAQQMRMGKSVHGVAQIYAPQGCAYCLDTGFYGRRAIFEMVEFNDNLRDVILKKPTIAQIRESLSGSLFTTLQSYGFQLVGNGLTSFDEIERVSGTD